MMYALMTSPWYFLDLRCSLKTERNLVVDLLAAILSCGTWEYRGLLEIDAAY